LKRSVTSTTSRCFRSFFRPRRVASSRRRQCCRWPQDLSAKQGHLRQLAGVVRRAEQRHELVCIVLQRRAGPGRESNSVVSAGAPRGSPDSPLLAPGERGFNFRTVRADHSRVTAFDFLGGPEVRLPTEVPVTFADSSDDGTCTRLAGDGKGPICVSLDSPLVKKAGSNPAFDQRGYPEGRLQIDQLGTTMSRLSSQAASSIRCLRIAAYGHRRHARSDVALVC
jgi:hypothetical protein